MMAGQQRAIGRLLAAMEARTPLVVPAIAGDDEDAAREQALSMRIAGRLRTTPRFGAAVRATSVGWAWSAPAFAWPSG